MSDTDIGAAFLADALKNLRGYKKLAERAFEQTDDADFFRALDPESNSIAHLVKHMAGNMRSRWTDFLTTDGEKPERDRDQEFVIDAGTSRAEVMRWWEAGWQSVFQAVEPLTPADLLRKVTIAGREHSVLEAIDRQLLHYGGHINQIVMLAKHFRGSAWQSLTIPKGQSDTYARTFERDLAARGDKP